MTKLLAYHGSDELKSEVVADMRADIEADRLVAGEYWNDETHTGCHIGCVLHARAVRKGLDIDINYNSHTVYGNLIGVPIEIAILVENLFESLGKQYGQSFSLAFLDSINPGADLSDVPRQFKLWLLDDARQHFRHDGVLSVIDEVIRLLNYGGSPDEWTAARFAANTVAAANTAAAAAARTASYAAYAAAADAAAAYAADAAAAVAAVAAAVAAARTDRYVVRDAARKKQAQKLNELVRSA